LPAIKEFLQGEHFYRRRQFDSVLVHGARAIALDSSFALAYHRMALVLSWDPPTEHEYAPSRSYAFKAAASNRGLAPRDSLLIAADSGLFALVTMPDDSAFAAVGLRQQVFSRLSEATRRFPADPEAWIELGEAHYWLEPIPAPLEALQAFDRAIAIDSGFTPAYEHVLQLALLTAGENRARQYARAYLTLGTTDASSAMRLAALLLDATRSQSAETMHLIDTIGVRPLWQAGLEYLGAWTDSAETAVRLLRALPAGRRSLAGAIDWIGDTLMWPQYLAGRLLYRGHAREAYEVYRQRIARPDTNWWAEFSNPLLDLALVNAIPADTVTAVIARSSARGQSWHRWLPWWLARGDTGALVRAVEQAERQVRQTRNPLDMVRSRAWRSAASAYLALGRGDSTVAIRDLEAMPDSVCGCPRQKLTLAQLLVARGDDRRAGMVLDQWAWSSGGSGPSFVFLRLERARIAERLGDREKAMREYQFVADVWHNADPELQVYVAEAREGLRRLGAEPRH
jgi:tetratricopeptide (TPR) repeat protein